jgi:hypothetical protein
VTSSVSLVRLSTVLTHTKRINANIDTRHIHNDESQLRTVAGAIDGHIQILYLGSLCTIGQLYFTQYTDVQ